MKLVAHVPTVRRDLVVRVDRNQSKVVSAIVVHLVVQFLGTASLLQEGIIRRRELNCGSRKSALNFTPLKMKPSNGVQAV